MDKRAPPGIVMRTYVKVGVISIVQNSFPIFCNTTRESGIKELNSFVVGVERDYDAVRAGLTFHWSQGPVEGMVNKIKTHKRLMYGCASFPLLRQKMLRLT